VARHRKVDLRMHGDEKYRRLTPCPPCGQALWWHLLTGRHTGIIPGLSSIGEAAFAEQLGWPIRGFRQAFAEVLREGMAKADWSAKLVWVPNAIKYNPPANPNVVRSWRDAWEELPECELKIEAHDNLGSFVEGLGKGFMEAFTETCRNPLVNPLPNQEQEQEQDQEFPPYPPGGREEELIETLAAQTGEDATLPANRPRFEQTARELLAAKPPYTPADVAEFGQRWREFCTYTDATKRDRPILKDFASRIGGLRSNGKLKARAKPMPTREMVEHCLKNGQRVSPEALAHYGLEGATP